MIATGSRPSTATSSPNGCAPATSSSSTCAPPAEYDARHIPGALSLPVTELGKRLREVPKNRRVVAYCRGPYCVYADDAVRTLRKRGYRAARLQDGYPEWAVAGLPVSCTDGRDKP